MYKEMLDNFRKNAIKLLACELTFLKKNVTIHRHPNKTARFILSEILTVPE